MIARRLVRSARFSTSVLAGLLVTGGALADVSGIQLNVVENSGNAISTGRSNGSVGTTTLHYDNYVHTATGTDSLYRSFVQSFELWNCADGGATCSVNGNTISVSGGWTLRAGQDLGAQGVLSNLTMSLLPYAGGGTSNDGGNTVVISDGGETAVRNGISGGNPTGTSALSNYYWTQSVVSTYYTNDIASRPAVNGVNYNGADNIAAPIARYSDNNYYEVGYGGLDIQTSNNPSWSGPLYPFQYVPQSQSVEGVGANGTSYTDGFFYDQPDVGPFGYFDAGTWISDIDASNKILTVYDGLNWGFNLMNQPGNAQAAPIGGNSQGYSMVTPVNYTFLISGSDPYAAAAVPEPATLTLLGLPALALLRRRRRAVA